MNALQRLWAHLEVLLPADEIAMMKRQYAEDAARDQRRSKYRRWLKYEQQALATLHLCQEEPLYLDIKESALRKLQHAQTWLAEHQDWA